MKVLKLFSKIFKIYLRLTTTLIMGTDLALKQKHLEGEIASIILGKKVKKDQVNLEQIKSKIRILGVQLL